MGLKNCWSYGHEWLLLYMLIEISVTCLKPPKLSHYPLALVAVTTNAKAGPDEQSNRRSISLPSHGNNFLLLLLSKLIL